jgi:O-antigen/teichoic acid export membrane protein
VALVAQSVVQQLVRLAALVVLGRPSLRVALHRHEANELWRFGQAVLLTTVMFTVYGNVDNLVVGAVLGPAPLGNYSFAYNLALIPFFLLSMTGTRTLLPLLARLRNAGDPLARTHVRSATAIASVAMLPLGFLALAGPSAVRVVFGHEWDAAGDVLRLLTLFSFLSVLGATSVPVLLVCHRAEVQRSIQLFQLLLLLALLYPATRWGGIDGTALAVAVPALIGTLFLVRAGARESGARTREILGRTGLAVAVGMLSGWVGNLLLLTGETWPALVLALATTTVTWAVLTSLTLPQTRALLVGRLLR